MPRSIEVILEYRLLGESVWRRLPITPSEYFDADYISDDEELDIDDVPLYAHAVQYLNLDSSLVENTKLSLINSRAGKATTIIETFWNGGANRVIERKDVVHDREQYWELIIDSQIPGPVLTNDIMRIGRKEGVLVVLSHVMITTKVDGSQMELKIHPNELQATPKSLSE
jgi:hypothetical protein